MVTPPLFTLKPPRFMIFPSSNHVKRHRIWWRFGAQRSFRHLGRVQISQPVVAVRLATAQLLSSLGAVRQAPGGGGFWLGKMGLFAWKIHGRPSSVWWKAFLENDQHHKKTMGTPLNNSGLASGKRSHMTMVYINHNMLMGKPTISMAFLNGYVSFQRVHGLPSSKLRVR